MSKPTTLLLSSLLLAPTLLACAPDALDSGFGSGDKADGLADGGSDGLADAGAVEPDAPIEREDVEDLPPGDATGTAMSGDFLATFVDSQCTCTGADSDGFCEVFGSEEDSDVFTLIQNDGNFMMDVFGAFALTGGIDEDGSFLIGMFTEDNGDGETLMRLRGQFDGPDSLTATFEWRMMPAPDFDAECLFTKEIVGERVQPEPFDPCADKVCGDACSICPPDDLDCVETAVVKVCNADGQCVADGGAVCQ